jgi:tetratricopeptide (TPR) repeat protein
VRLAALLFSIVWTSSSATADERAMGMLRDWILAVQQHVPDEPDAALARIHSWSYDDLSLMRAYVEALAGAPLKGNQDRVTRRRRISDRELQEIEELRTVLPRDFTTFLKRAALLHTDAVLLATSPIVSVPGPPPQQPGGRRQPTDQRINVRSQDGRIEGFEVANPHWEFAMDLLEALPLSPNRDPIVPLWFRAIGAHFARERNYADSLLHFARARRMVPDAPEVLFGEACLQETLGAPRNQEYVRITILPNGARFLDVEAPQTHFRRSEGLLRRALTGNPGLVEARLRLGRMLALLERHDEALTELRHVLAATPERAIAYYAHLFIGDTEQALGRLEAARAAYEAAIELYPRTQSARIGLGAVLRAAGDRSAALAAILPTLDEPVQSRDSADEPWWDYYDGDAANLATLMDRLRGPFVGPQ